MNASASSTSAPTPMPTALLATGWQRGSRLATTFASAIDTAARRTASIDNKGTSPPRRSPKTSATPARLTSAPAALWIRKPSAPWMTASSRVSSGTRARITWARPAGVSTSAQLISANVMPKDRKP
ncbi:MAG: hypothetical protein A2146_03870 [Actinobacteria bacterium RBG_16_67_10]|nr:MAG: hypothetical protein A2146_03870 [Actinobacteria bacterium RBG_16_67_10]